MKKKKFIYAVITAIILIAIITIIAVIVTKNNKTKLIDQTPPESKSIMDEIKKKYPDKEYNKLKVESF